MELNRTHAHNLAASLRTFLGNPDAVATDPSPVLADRTARTAPTPAREFTLSLVGAPARLLMGLLVISACLQLANAAVRTWYQLSVPHSDQLVRLWSVESEAGIPTFYSALVLLMAGLVLALIARVAIVERQPDRWHWAALAVIFVFLSIDEATAIHESTRFAVRRVMDADGLLRAAWVLPWSFLTAAFVLSFVPFLRRLNQPYARLFILAGALYVGGALGLEMLQGPVIERWGEATWQTEILPAIEEFMEMAGAALFLYAVLRYLIDHLGYRRIELR